ncbi:MAG TPA: MarR family transcriptional regulator, partial [Terriglobales bacterium]|nr:MarR family transcriptional regulator [Terriglobales bacterium]
SRLTIDDFRKQAEFRHHLRRFLRSSEINAKAYGLEPNQYQLLLAIKGLPESETPNISTMAGRLQIEQHSAVELVDRSVRKGVVERFREGSDRRKVFLRLTEAGEKMVMEIAMKNRQELLNSMPAFMEFLSNLH